MTEALAPDVRRTRAHLEAAITEMSRHADGPDTAPDVAGALAALEWLLGATDVAPISATVLPVAGNLSYEAARATLAADELGAGTSKSPPEVRAYARGVERVLYWAQRG